MDQFGEILDVKGEIATVRVQKHSTCSGCGRCGLAADDAKDGEVEVYNSVGAEIGQRVKITMDTSRVLRASFIVYLVPIIALVIGVVLGQQLLSLMGFPEDRSFELYSLFMGGALFILSYFFIRRWDKKVKGNEKYRPIAVKVIEEMEE